jgi:hypothetical protein
MVSALTLRVVAKAVVGIACAILGAGAESFMIGTGDQGCNVVIRRGRGCNRVVGMRSTAGRNKTGRGKKGECNRGELHSVLTFV